MSVFDNNNIRDKILRSDAYGTITKRKSNKKHNFLTFCWIVLHAIRIYLPSFFFFFRPTELDALVFGHVFTIITTRLPCRRLAETVKKHTTLVALAKRVDERYFKRP